MVATVGPLLAILLGTSTGASAWCAETEKELLGLLDLTEIQKEPESTLRYVFTTATEAWAKCPQAEGLAYLRVRSAELGGGKFVGELPAGGLEELRKLTAEAARRFPRSARILTARARTARDAVAARGAVAIDPNYAPARVALADILVDAGEWAEAQKVLRRARTPNGAVDVFTVLARIDLAKGDRRSALAQAERALKAPSMNSVEPDAGDPRPVMRAHAVAALAAIALGRFQRAAVHLSGADPEDPLIRDVLRDPPRDLARALRARPSRPAN